MTKILASCAILLALSGCAGIGLREAPAGWECDPSGACWPTSIRITKPIRYLTVGDPNSYCRASRAQDADLAANPSWGIMACTIGEKLASPIVVLPESLTRHQLACGYTIPGLKAHETGHALGLTRHNMIARKEGC